MKETKFTKGEWHKQIMSNNDISIDSNTGLSLCYISADFETDRANADLIATAPEMYKFLDDLANGRGTDYPIEQLLAKARGEL